MGEYAEMMLDGTCCSVCGEFLGGSEGYPITCPSCRDDERGNQSIAYTKCGQPRPSKTNCPTCGKLVKKAGLADHQRDVHGVS